MQDFKDKPVTVLGFGKSGASTAQFLLEHGAKVLVSDSAARPDPLFEGQARDLEARGVRFELGGHSQAALRFSDLIVASPGMSAKSEVISRALSLSKKVICDIELAFRNTRIPIIGVTGTNGKSTTTALISHILSSAGLSAPACGNFGVPILSQLDQVHDYLVVEVSSFQLEYCLDFAPQVAVWLNFAPDHIDWHGSLEHYRASKQKIFANQNAQQYAVLNIDDTVVVQAGLHSKAKHVAFSVESNLSDCAEISKRYAYFAYVEDKFLVWRSFDKIESLCGCEELQIRGEHNLENALAATAACAVIGIDTRVIAAGLKTFRPLEHRLEYAGSINAVAFYNDSKATNVSSTLKALRAFPDEKIVLIAGGRDKGTGLEEFVSAAKASTAAVILLGEAKQRFGNALSNDGYTQTYLVDSMDEAVRLGVKLNCGPVVLSPACASYDMFKNYEERGRVFKELVAKWGVTLCDQNEPSRRTA